MGGRSFDACYSGSRKCSQQNLYCCHPERSARRDFPARAFAGQAGAQSKDLRFEACGRPTNARGTRSNENLRYCSTLPWQPLHSKKQNIQVANHRQDEGMVQADAICQQPLHFGNDRAAHDGHNEQARSFSG